MTEALWAALVREYEQLARTLGLADDTCFVCMVPRQGQPGRGHGPHQLRVLGA
jgi:hypothetical protein